MKVLFAVNNENVSDTIIKKYLKDYREILSFNNVYYFNAIKKEIQKDKTYDRIVISEDLEPFSSNNYEAIDKSIFEKLDAISDEAHDSEGNEIPIILICSDRHTKNSEFLVKLFSIGVYNALIGNDRSKAEVCKLINKPRTKKEGKLYYKIDSDNANYRAQNENEVNENEIQNIITHFKKLGRDYDKYAVSFDKIANQYTDEQLRIIINCLPIKVKTVLSEKSPKFQEFMSISGEMVKGVKSKIYENNDAEKRTGVKIDLIESKKKKITEPIVIPNAVKSKKRVIEESKLEDAHNDEDLEKKKRLMEIKKKKRMIEIEKRKRLSETKEENNIIKPSRKNVDISDNNEINKKSKNIRETENLNKKSKLNKKLSIDEEEDDDRLLKKYINEDIDEDDDLGFDEDILDVVLDNDEDDTLEEDFEEDEISNIVNPKSKNNQIEKIENKIDYSMSNLSGLLTRDKKIVAFIGSHKNGVSFLVNNLAEIFSSVGINTAILDMTKNRNSYYIYTKNEESLRKIAYSSIDRLQKGVASGIKAKNNVSVYTTIPNDENEYPNVENILSTLVKNHSLVLIDCDFDTPISYFANAQEIYLVQTMDILTIQPLTEFLRELKSQDILDAEKIKIVINKEVKVKGLSNKEIIGGMSSYNDPAMSFMTELFNKDVVRYCSIPFEETAYSKYLESLLNCKISLNGYSKNFIARMKVLADMVYPLTSRQSYSSSKDQGYSSYSNNGFSSSMNNTLNKMKKKI